MRVMSYWSGGAGIIYPSDFGRVITLFVRGSGIFFTRMQLRKLKTGTFFSRCAECRRSQRSTGMTARPSDQSGLPQSTSLCLKCRDTGEVLWRLGGKGSNFRIVNDERGQFYGQHDVREVKKNRISMFDNGLHSETGTSRGVEYDLIFDSDGHPFEARLVYSYDTATRVYAHGSYRRMPNGNGVYCLGLEGTKWQLRGPGPFYVETRHGKELIRMDWTADADRLQLGGTYRTLKGPWTGTPTWPPAVVLDDKNPSNTLRLHFSWNGATTVKKWRIMRGETVSELIDVLAEVEKKQFEHWVDILGGTHKCQYFQAVALDGEGKELKRSKVLGLAACDL
mmetsp:Transcript_16746/g.47685  ORF Transcript_16746/g.47685 Transcript_16746/m.47685 type:complete len:337 (-) Transcript_16746:254-1264(-)